jgi:hypothetical protein
MGDGVVGSHSASELLRVGIPRKQVIICLTDELDLTEAQAEAALSIADTPIEGSLPAQQQRTKIRRRQGADAG